MGNSRTLDVRGIILRVMITVVMVVSLSPASAFAAAGSLTVNAAANADAAYRAYLAFSGDVDDQGKVTDIAWPGDTAKAAILAYLDANGYEEWLAGTMGWTYEGAHDAAENAALYCRVMISGSDDAAGWGGSPKPKAGDSFAYGLAMALRDSGVQPAAISGGVAAEVAQGYYLVLTDRASVSDGEAATAPVWVAVGESTEVGEKAALPALSAEVSKDAEDGFARATDASCGQLVYHRVAATLPSNLLAFPSYTLNLGISMEKLGEYDRDAVKVYMGGTDVTEALVSRSGGSLSRSGAAISVAFDDVLDAAWGAAAGDEVVVEFATSMVNAPNSAGTGYDLPYGLCTAELTYPADPANPGTTKRMATTSRVYAFTLLVSVTDAGTGQAATEATYDLQIVDNGDAALAGKHVAGDGKASDYGLASKNSLSNPLIAYHGLGSGTYLARQTGMSSGYPRQDSDIEVAISAEYDDEGVLEELTATVSGGYLATSFGAGGTSIVAIDEEAGSVHVDSEVSRIVAMPLTGLPADRAPYVAAGLFALVGCALLTTSLMVRRRRAHEAEGSFAFERGACWDESDSKPCDDGGEAGQAAAGDCAEAAELEGVR